MRASIDERGGSTRSAQVVGLGLIGTSVAAALSERGWFVTGQDKDAVRAARARDLHAINGIGIDRLAEIAVIATPVDEVPTIAEALLRDSDRDDLVVTDVGSTKAAVLAKFDHPRFVGGHPMAGSEQEGPDGADPELFEGATWVLTPTELTDPNSFSRIRSLVVDFGAEPVALSPDSHDGLVAVVSHLPHLVAANLMVLAEDASENHAALLRLAAGGFRDMTRIAAGDPAMWPDVFRSNAKAVTAVIDDLIERLTAAREIVATKDRAGLVAVLERARVARRNLPARVARPESVVELRVPVPDRRGVLAEVTTVLGEADVDIFDFEIAHSAEGPRGVLVITIARADEDRSRSALFARGYRPATVATGLS